MSERRWSVPLLLGSGLTLALLLASLAGLLWPPASAQAMDMAQRLQAPSSAHWLGTDAYGRDVAAQLLQGAHSSLAVALCAVGLGLVLGTALGLWAAARRGWVEALIMRCADFSFAFPVLLSAITLGALWGPGMKTVIVALALANVPVFARLSRASAHSLWAREFVLAARACGRTQAQITRIHILPHLVPLLLVQATVQCALAILAEAALSYLGLGTQAPEPSWGRMLSEAQTLMFQAPLLALWPGCAIALTVLGLNLLGDGLRDRLDPRRR
ncbi:MAG: ABC transporter permease [Comamonadaceae bacterium]|jgi:peptide/nickel transport system permease protein|nr:ABC transporter permease [Comamonadaceae bacterium]